MADYVRCYRVWFTDGSAILCDAASTEDAPAQAKALLPEGDDREPVRAEQLTLEIIS